MYLLSIIFAVLIIFLLLFSILLFYKNGSFIKTKFGITSVTIFILLITFITYTSFPSNFHLQIISSIVFGIIGVIGVILTKYNKTSYNLGRMLILISMFLNFFILIK